MCRPKTRHAKAPNTGGPKAATKAAKQTAQQKAQKAAEKAAEPKSHEECIAQRCAICLEEAGRPNKISGTEYLLKLSCCHQILGSNCIRKWLTEHKKCPLCRSPCAQREELVVPYEDITEAALRDGNLNIVTRTQEVRYSGVDTVRFHLNEDKTNGITISHSRLSRIDEARLGDLAVTALKFSAKALSVASRARISHYQGFGEVVAVRSSTTTDPKRLLPYMVRVRLPSSTCRCLDIKQYGAPEVAEAIV